MTGQPFGSCRTVLRSHEIDFDESLLAGVMDARDPEAYADLAAPQAHVIVIIVPQADDLARARDRRVQVIYARR